MANKKINTKKKESNTTVAKQKDGTVQITMTIPWKTIEEKRTHAATEMAKNITVPGFRKGKAPLSKAIPHLAEEQLIENTLSTILPKIFSDVIQEEKLKPAIYPKFQLMHAHENEDWQVMATTCEVPEIKLGDYKKTIKSEKDKKKTKKKEKETTREEKENKLIEILLDKFEVTVPKMLVEEEANSRLSSLLERLETLGLSLENYLASMKKDAAEMRKEYEDQAEKSIKLDFLLQKIADEEKITVSDKEADDYMKAGAVSEQQKNTVKLFLRKRKTLDNLVSLI